MFAVSCNKCWVKIIVYRRLSHFATRSLAFIFKELDWTRHLLPVNSFLNKLRLEVTAKLIKNSFSIKDLKYASKFITRIELCSCWGHVITMCEKFAMVCELVVLQNSRMCNLIRHWKIVDCVNIKLMLHDFFEKFAMMCEFVIFKICECII